MSNELRKYTVILMPASLIFFLLSVLSYHYISDSVYDLFLSYRDALIEDVQEEYPEYTLPYPAEMDRMYTLTKKMQNMVSLPLLLLSIGSLVLLIKKQRSMVLNKQ